MEKEKPQQQPNNPLHGIKLADILDELVAHYGWEKLSVTRSKVPV